MCHEPCDCIYYQNGIFWGRFWRRMKIHVTKLISLHVSRVSLVAAWLQPLNNEGEQLWYLCERLCTTLQRLCIYFHVPTSCFWHNKPSVQEEIQVLHLPSNHHSHCHYECQFTHLTPQHNHVMVRDRHTRPIQPLPSSLDVQRQNIDVSSSISIFPTCGATAAVWSSYWHGNKSMETGWNDSEISPTDATKHCRGGHRMVWRQW